jgi:NAD(P)-dependent dehydrogenase (short-subunit alcohol dehydrogenase family)
VARIIAACGDEPLSLVVNNAGLAVVRPVEAIASGEWAESLAVNVTAPFLLVQGLLPRLRRGSSVVNVLSVAARRGFPGWTAYCAAKFGLEGLSQALREELRPRGIRVINVYPSATDTDLWRQVEGTWDRSRMLAPAQVADAIAFALERPPEVSVDTIEIGHASGVL